MQEVLQRREEATSPLTDAGVFLLFLNIISTIISISLSIFIYRDRVMRSWPSTLLESGLCRV